MKACECGAIGITMNVIKKQINNANICRKGCGILKIITMNKSISTKIVNPIIFIATVGGNNTNVYQSLLIDTIVCAMKTHISNAEVCQQGCGALSNISFHSKSNNVEITPGETITISVDNKMRVGECESIDTITNIMKMHVNDAEICYNGCGVLMNITINNGIIMFNEYQ